MSLGSGYYGIKENISPKNSYPQILHHVDLVSEFILHVT